MGHGMHGALRGRQKPGVESALQPSTPSMTLLPLPSMMLCCCGLAKLPLCIAAVQLAAGPTTPCSATLLLLLFLFIAGAYLCVRAYASAGTVSYSLRASLDRCPATFDNSGTKLMCSTPADAPEAERRFSECTPTGECVCTGPWAKPVPEVHPGEAWQAQVEFGFVFTLVVAVALA